MPSRRHDLLAWAIPRLRKSRELDNEPAERARVERWHAELDRSLPTRLVPRFGRRWSVITEELPGFASYVVTRRGSAPERTLLHLHGGGFMAPIDPGHVRYATRLASALDARLLLPDYPLAPEHTWADSHDALVDLAARWAGDSRELIIAGDSAGGGLALAVAQSLRDRGGPQPSKLLLISPWVDLSTSTPETAGLDPIDPWLFLGKVKAYARWWAGSDADLTRTEVSPALGDLSGLPPALMFSGTRDLLVPGCRLLVRRAAEAGWDLTYVEREGLLHVYPLLPFIPEAREARHQTVAFLRP
ncbi:MAG: alpha/beta hydrolase [Nocardioides sp.]